MQGYLLFGIPVLHNQVSTVFTKPERVTIRMRVGRFTFPLFIFNIRNDHVSMNKTKCSILTQRETDNQ